MNRPVWTVERFMALPFRAGPDAGESWTSYAQLHRYEVCGEVFRRVEMMRRAAVFQPGDTQAAEAAARR